MTSHMAREIAEQPAAVERLLREGHGAAGEVARRIASAHPAFIVIAARGSSDNAARYAQYLFGARLRLPVALATPSLYADPGSAPHLEGAVVIAISQSGRSPDVVSVVAAGRRAGAPTIAITNDPGSPLAAAAELVLPLYAGPEQSVAATKTYLNSLAAVALLGALIEGDPDRLRALRALPETIATAVETCAAPAAALAEAWPATDRAVVLGRGFNMATAFETALKLKELAYVLAEPFSTADFLHGPVAIVDRGFPVLAVLGHGAIPAETEALIATLAARRANLVRIGADDSELPAPRGPDWLEPLVLCVPGQHLAHALARRANADIDHPRGLGKITLTH